MSVTIKGIRAICTASEGINPVVAKVEINQPRLYGLGCAILVYRHPAMETTVEEYLDPLLKGRDAKSIEELWQLMHQNAYWRSRPAENSVTSGVDMAFWDTKGKLAGMPAYQLFGEKCCQGTPTYRHADGWDLDELCENIQRFQEMGIRTIQCQCDDYGGDTYGSTPKNPTANSLPGAYLDSRSYVRDTVNLFEGIRSKIGYEMSLVHGVHECATPAEAICPARLLEPYGLLFLGDPVPIEQTEWPRQLRRQTSIPIAGGELFNSPAEWKMLITKHLIDSIRVYISQIGGITSARKPQIFAEQLGIRTVWHGPGDMSPLAHTANTHVDLAALDFGAQEWSSIESPNFVTQGLKGPHGALLEVFSRLPEYEGGYVYTNDKPGPGIDSNEKEVVKYPYENTATTQVQIRKKDGAL